MDDLKVTLAVVATVVFIVLLGAFLLFTWWRGQKFNAALDELGRQFRMKVAIHGYSAASSAEGKIRGHEVSLRQTSRSSSASSSTPRKNYLEYKVDVAGLGNVRIVPAGQWAPTVRDYSGGGDKKSPLGDHDFDQRYDVWNARKSALKRLQAQQAREALDVFLARGGYIEHGNLIFERVHRPTSKEGLLEDLNPMLDLADQLRKQS